MMIDRDALNLVLQWPQLACPASPEPPSPECDVQQLVAHDCFAEPVRLRCPADSVAGLVGPIIGNGPCMEPQYPSGTAFWIDPMLPGRDGDLVAVWISKPEMQRIVERNSGRAGWPLSFAAAHPSIRRHALRSGLLSERRWAWSQVASPSRKASSPTTPARLIHRARHR